MKNKENIDVIGSTDVEHLAQLARLSFSEQQKNQLQADILKILGYVEQLQALDLDLIPPTSHVMELQSVLRADKKQPGLVTDKVFLNAPEAESDYFKVPQIMSGD